jgi:hypothetical protein
VRDKCKHLGDFVPGTTGTRPRACALGVLGGVVYRLRDCERCSLHTGLAPCEHFSELTGAGREARGLSHGKRWGLCLHEAKPLGEVVCPCKGCGPKCPGYSSGEQT